MFHLYLGIFSLTENVEKHFQFKKSGSLRVQKQRITDARFLILDIFFIL